MRRADLVPWATLLLVFAGCGIFSVPFLADRPKKEPAPDRHTVTIEGTSYVASITFGDESGYSGYTTIAPLVTTTTVGLLTITEWEPGDGMLLFGGAEPRWEWTSSDLATVFSGTQTRVIVIYEHRPGDWMGGEWRPTAPTEAEMRAWLAAQDTAGTSPATPGE